MLWHSAVNRSRGPDMSQTSITILLVQLVQAYKQGFLDAAKLLSGNFPTDQMASDAVAHLLISIEKSLKAKGAKI